MKKWAWVISLIAGLIIIGGAVGGFLKNKEDTKDDTSEPETAYVQVVEA